MQLSSADDAASAAIYLITGVQAAGKTTVARALAERLPEPSVHVHGDQFRRWIVNGRRDMSPNAVPDAVGQLQLRHRLTAATCDLYTRSGFSVVAQDVILGPHLELVIDMIRSRPLHVVVLAPRVDVIARREDGRRKHSYQQWTIAELDHELRHETPRLGLWLDTSDHTISQSVDAILQRSTEARIIG